MNLKATCDSCGRDLLLEQLLSSDNRGRCPWCGQAMASHYLQLLARAIPRTEAAGNELVRALEVLSGAWTGFTLIEESVLDPVLRALGVAASSASRRPSHDERAVELNAA
ncbi:MAG: hypothetical protein ACRDLB_06100 [Actinomycetota bacterium]